MKPERKTILKTIGVVSLKQLERQEIRLFVVSYPAKFGTIRECQQFLTLVEANRCFTRFAQFFLRQEGQ